MEQVWFIAGPTNLIPKYSVFFNNNNFETKIFSGYINILETKVITVNPDNIDIITEILEILKLYDDIDFIPRFKLNNPEQNDLVYYNKYPINYYMSKEDGCDCHILYQYDLLETPKFIKCFMKNNKYYGKYHIIEKKLIFTREEITKMNEKIWKITINMILIVMTHLIFSNELKLCYIKIYNNTIIINYCN